MSRKLWLVMAVLALAACQAKQTEEVAVVPVPATVAVIPTPAPVAEPVGMKPVETPVAVAATVPAVVAPTPAVETKPVAVAAPPPVGTPVVAPKPVSQPVVAKPPVPAPPVAPKVVASTISDADGIALAKKRNCFACHMIDKKVVGPAWKEVATKYRGDSGAQARMEAKIGKGGSGAWGSMAMPPQPQVTAEERAILARFILSLK